MNNGVNLIANNRNKNESTNALEGNPNQKKIEDLDIKVQYKDLTPTISEALFNNYKQQFEFAFNENKIKNIAVTGVYGSGKSSVIESYLEFGKIYENHKIAKVSLASFTDADIIIKKSSGEEVIDDTLLQKSILQQLFYKVEKQTVPSSRIRRTEKTNKWGLFWSVNFCISLFILALIIVSESFLDKLYLFYNKFSYPLFSMLLLFLIFLAFNIFLFFAIEYFKNNFHLSRIATKFGEIETKRNDEESLFSHYLDEIIYYFQETEMDIVIFEDIDRFDKAEIFTKLRELNIILNNSQAINKKRNKPIKFIYAIRDDMFDGVKKCEDYSKFSHSVENRTKFFDFIIAIVSVANTYNSRHQLVTEFKDVIESMKPSKNSIISVSPLLKDMRMIKNIVNEYCSFYQIHSTSYNNIELDESIKDQIFGLIVYKNLEPKEYGNALKNSGELYDLYIKRSNELEKLSKDKTGELIKLRGKTNNTLNRLSFDESDIKLLYLTKLLGHTNNLVHVFYKGSANYVSENINNLSSRFNDIVKLNKSGVEYSFDQILTANNQLPNMLDVISQQEKNFVIFIEQINEEVRKLENKIKNLYNLEYAELISEGLLEENKVFDHKVSYSETLKTLVKANLIQSNYPTLLTVSVQGDRNLNDMIYLNGLASIDKHSNVLGYGYNLANVAEVYKEVRLEDYSKHNSLNISLFMYLWQNSGELHIKVRLYRMIKTAIDNHVLSKFLEAILNKNRNFAKYLFELLTSELELESFDEIVSIFKVKNLDDSNLEFSFEPSEISFKFLTSILFELSKFESNNLTNVSVNAKIKHVLLSVKIGDLLNSFIDYFEIKYSINDIIQENDISKNQLSISATSEQWNSEVENILIFACKIGFNIRISRFSSYSALKYDWIFKAIIRASTYEINKEAIVMLSYYVSYLASDESEITMSNENLNVIKRIFSTPFSSIEVKNADTIDIIQKHIYSNYFNFISILLTMKGIDFSLTGHDINEFVLKPLMNCIIDDEINDILNTVITKHINESPILDYTQGIDDEFIPRYASIESELFYGSISYFELNESNVEIDEILSRRLKFEKLDANRFKLLSKHENYWTFMKYLLKFEMPISNIEVIVNCLFEYSNDNGTQVNELKLAQGIIINDNSSVGYKLVKILEASIENWNCVLSINSIKITSLFFKKIIEMAKKTDHLKYLEIFLEDDHFVRMLFETSPNNSQNGMISTIIDNVLEKKSRNGVDLLTWYKGLNIRNYYSDKTIQFFKLTSNENLNEHIINILKKTRVHIIIRETDILPSNSSIGMEKNLIRRVLSSSQPVVNDIYKHIRENMKGEKIEVKAYHIFDEFEDYMNWLLLIDDIDEYEVKRVKFYVYFKKAYLDQELLKDFNDQ